MLWHQTAGRPGLRVLFCYLFFFFFFNPRSMKPNTSHVMAVPFMSSSGMGCLLPSPCLARLLSLLSQSAHHSGRDKPQAQSRVGCPEPSLPPGTDSFLICWAGVPSFPTSLSCSQSSCLSPSGPFNLWGRPADPLPTAHPASLHSSHIW